MFARGEAEEAYQRTRRIEARQIPELGQDRHRRDRRHAAQTHQRLGCRPQRPRSKDIAHLGFESRGPGLCRPDRVHVLLKDHLLDRKIEFLLLEPAKMRLCPPGLPVVDPAMAEKERSQALTALELHRLHVLARTGQIAHRLLVTSRHPHRRQLPGSVKPRQAHRVAAIRLHPIPRLARNQARCYDLAVVAGLGDLAIHSVAAALSANIGGTSATFGITEGGGGGQR